MTETSGSIETNSVFFDETLKENLNLFFARNDTKAPLSELTETDAVKNAVIAEDPNKDNSSATANLSPRHVKLKALAVIGAAAIVYAGAHIGLSKLNKTPSQDNKTPTELSVNLKSLPKLLPVAVMADVNNVGILDDEVYSSQSIAATSTNYENDSWGSAVEITPTLFLTAGHVIVNSINNNLIKGSSCQQVTFTSISQRDFLVSEYGTTSVKPVANIPDLEVLSLPQSAMYQQYYDPAKEITIAPNPPRVGEDLYFINDEPVPSGFQADYGLNMTSIYGGVYEGSTSYGSYDVITGLKSYAQDGLESSIGGASGGMVVNARGQVVGLSVAASDNSANNEIVTYSSVKEYQAWDGVKFTGLRPNSKLSDSVVQPVTRSLINRYVGMEHSITQNCFPEGGEQ